MIRAILVTIALLSAAPAWAGEAEEAARQQKLEAQRQALDTQLATLRDRKAALEKERDAARINANTYVLPRYKLEVEAKQKDIDQVDSEISVLEKQRKDLEK